MKKWSVSAGVCSLRTALFAMGLAIATAPLLSGQDPKIPETQAGPPVTVHGVVLNAATGQPLPRVLVKVTTDKELGVLTDGEGRFEIHGVPAGVHVFEAIKPGFEAWWRSGEGESVVVPHMVHVAAGMPELSFSLTPKNAIYGHITLSTGVPGLGIGIALLRQQTVEGRVVWQEIEQHQTTPDSSFRFSGLRDGTYLLRTQPEFDNESSGVPQCNADAPTEMTGFASSFYGETSEMGSAARIVIAGGQSIEANLTLNLTKFYLVQVSLARALTSPNWEISHLLLDRAGQMVEYPVYDEKNHLFCAYLPSGSYMFSVDATATPPPGGFSPLRTEAAPKELVGLLEFSVDGQTNRNLRVPLGQRVATPVHVRFEPGPPALIRVTGPDGNEIAQSDADWLEISESRVNGIAQKGGDQIEATPTRPNSFELSTAAPGSYWIHVDARRQGICVGTVSAGGQNLARVPWSAGSSLTGAPIDVVLRTDCAKLTVEIPPAFAAEGPGEGATLYVYAVPTFDSVAAASQGQIQQFGEHTFTLEDLTPGPYRVFVFRAPRSIPLPPLSPLLSPATLDQLGSGQDVMLAPGASVNLVLEGISR